MFKKNTSNDDGQESSMSDFDFSTPQPSEDAEFDEKLSHLITSYIGDGYDESVLVSKWIVVAEVIDSDTAPALITMSSDSVSPWDYIGMLRTRANAIELGYSAAINSAYAEDVDDED